MRSRLIKIARLGHTYGMGAARLARLITSPNQKITRKNAMKLQQAFDAKWKSDGR